MKTETKSWHAETTNKGSAHEQGLIIDENTGANIAVSYDPKDAPLLAAGPDLLEAAKDILDWLEKRYGAPMFNPHMDMLRDAIRKAEPEAMR